MNGKPLDALLIAIIVGSAGLIGYKLYERSGAAQVPPRPAAVVPRPPTPVAPSAIPAHPPAASQPIHTPAGNDLSKATAAATPVPAAGTPGSSAGETKAVRLKIPGPPRIQISTEDWDKVVTETGLQSHALQAAPYCAPKEPGLPMIPAGDEGFANAIANGKANVLFGFPRPVCIRVNDKAPVVRLFTDPESPVLGFGALVEVDRVLATKLKETPQILFAKLAITAEDFRVLHQGTTPLPEYDLFIHIKPLENAPPPEFPPRGLPSTDEFTVESVEKMNSGGVPKAYILDVRSEAEYKAGHIKGSTNSPYILPPNVSKKFSWAVKNRDLATASISLNKAFAVRGNGKIVVVGAGPSDPRPVYFIRHLLKLGFTEIGWIYDGVPRDGKK